MKVSRLLGATAVATVLAMPAMAQTVIFQGTNVFNTDVGVGELTVLQQLNQAGGFNFTSMPLNLNSLVPGDYGFASGRNNASEVVQIATGNLNVLGAGSLSGDFIVVQGAGNYVAPGIGADPSDAVYGNTVVSIVNANGLWTTNPLLSSTIVSGSQVGQINVNTVNTAVETGVTNGQIWQQAGTDGSFLGLQPPAFGFPAGPVLSVDNAMVAITQNGIAEVRGTMIDQDADDATAPFINEGAMQAAIVSLNGVNIELAAGATLNLVGDVDLGTSGLKQELTGNNSIAVRNIAAAVSTANASATIDPSVSDIRQMAVVNINSVGFSTPDGDATVNLAGGQFGIPVDTVATPVFAPELSTYVRLGNVAAAVAGSPDLGALGFGGLGGLNDPTAWTSNGGAGIAVISGVDQVAALQLNTISNTVGIEGEGDDAQVIGVANLNLGGARLIDPLLPPESTITGAFEQTFDAATLAIVPVQPGGTNIVNLLVASTGPGTATITDSSQAYVVNINSVDVGGALSGALVQEAFNVGASVNLENGPLSNVALASSSGAAKIDGLTQAMQQSYNTVSAGSLNGLYLVQDASNVDLTNINVATAASLNSSATLKGVIQVSSLNVNTISANAISGSTLNGAGSITQVAGIDGVGGGVINLASVNTLTSTGTLNSSIQSAIQQSSISLNAIGVK